MEAAEPEMIHQRAQVFRAEARIVAIERRRVDVAAARIADDAMAGLRKHRLLIAPDEAAASRWMQEHDRDACPARVPVPKLRPRERRHGLLGGRLRRDRRWRDVAGLALRRRNAQYC